MTSLSSGAIPARFQTRRIVVQILVMLLVGSHGLSQSTGGGTRGGLPQPDEALIKDTVMRSQCYEIELCKHPDYFRPASLDTFWTATALTQSRQSDRARIIQEISNLKAKGLHYADTSCVTAENWQFLVSRYRAATDAFKAAAELTGKVDYHTLANSRNLQMEFPRVIIQGNTAVVGTNESWFCLLHDASHRIVRKRNPFLHYPLEYTLAKVGGRWKVVGSNTPRIGQSVPDTPAASTVGRRVQTYIGWIIGTSLVVVIGVGAFLALRLVRQR